MSSHDQPVAPHLLDRQFEADRPNQRWVDDTTELLIGDFGAKFSWPPSSTSTRASSSVGR
jgi:transposase InsO family protein